MVPHMYVNHNTTDLLLHLESAGELVGSSLGPTLLHDLCCSLIVTTRAQHPHQAGEVPG